MLLFNNFSVPMIISTVLVMLFSMSFHEFAHALMATWWGDDTPRRMGRLTLNPLVHINWVGFLMFVFIGFGILGSVPVNVRQMRNPRWGAFWTSFAGPLMNLAIAVVAAIGLRLIAPTAPYAGINFMLSDSMPGDFLGVVQDWLILILTAATFWNLLLFFFNLLPFFPIDGWRMVLALLPGYFLARDQVPDFIRKNVRPLSLFLQQPAYKWEQWAIVSQYVLFILIALSFITRGQLDPLGDLINAPAINLWFRLLGIG